MHTSPALNPRFIPKETMLGMKLQYASLEADVYTEHFDPSAPELRKAAMAVFQAAFRPYPVADSDIQIYCSSLEGGPQCFRVAYRASWDPPMTDVELIHGLFDGVVMHLPGPTGTVTMCSGVGTYDYDLAGYNPTSHHYVFSLKEKVPQPS